MTPTYSIYGLYDRAIGRYFYIGIATNTVSRMKSHRATYKSRPHLFVVFDYCTAGLSFTLLVEQAYMIAAMDLGHPIINSVRPRKNGGKLVAEMALEYRSHPSLITEHPRPAKGP